MSAHLIDFTTLDELVAALRAAGVRDVSTDPADLNLPGVWVNLTGITYDLLAGITYNTRLVAVAGDTDTRRAMDTLAELVNTITTVVDPSGPVTATTLLMPENPTPCPALSVPFNLSTHP